MPADLRQHVLDRDITCIINHDHDRVRDVSTGSTRPLWLALRPNMFLIVTFCIVWSLISV